MLRSNKHAVAPYGCTEGVHPSLPNAKGHLQVSSLLLSWITHWCGLGAVCIQPTVTSFLATSVLHPRCPIPRLANLMLNLHVKRACMIITISVDLCTQKLPTILYYYNYYCYIIHSIYGEHMHNTYLISTVLLITYIRM